MNPLAVIKRDLPPGALRLAYHAALPVVIDPDLLHLLRLNFFNELADALSYEVEFALLLSPVFREVGDALYEISPDLRDLLLVGLHRSYPPDRIRAIATLLWKYTERLTPWQEHPELERAQQLTALSVLDPARASAWLEQAANIQHGDQLRPEWYVAMRQRLNHQPSAHLTLDDDVELLFTQLSDPDEDNRVSALRELARLIARNQINRDILINTLSNFVNNHPRVQLTVTDTLVNALAQRAPDIQYALALLGSLATSAQNATVDLQRVDLRGADLPNLDWTAARIDRVRLDDASLPGINLAGAHISQTNLSGAYLWRARLEAANASAVELNQAQLEGADLSGSHLIATSAHRALLREANLSSAVLIGMDFRSADLRRARLTGANLSHANLSGVNLMAADLTGANLTGTDLTGANLTGTDLTGANLTGTDFTGVDLTRAILSRKLRTGLVSLRAGVAGSRDTSNGYRELSEVQLGSVEGTELTVRVDSRPWTAPIDTLVISVSAYGWGQLGAAVAAAFPAADWYSTNLDTITPDRPTTLLLGDVTGATHLRCVILSTIRDPLLSSSSSKEPPATLNAITRATTSAVATAARRGTQSLGLPLLGAGAVGFPVDSVADALVPAARAALAKHGGSSLQRLIFVCRDESARVAIERAWQKSLQVLTPVETRDVTASNFILVDQLRARAAAHPDAFTPDLAGALNNLSNRLAELGRREEALAAIDEAVQVYRQLAAAHPDAFTPDLAGALTTLGIRLAELQRHQEALIAYREAVQLYVHLQVNDPSIFSEATQNALENLIIGLRNLGRTENDIERELEPISESCRSTVLAPGVAVDRDLALGGGRGVRVAGFHADVSRLIKGGRIDSLVADRLPALAQKVSEVAVNGITERHVIPAFRQWRSGQIATLNDMTSRIAVALNAELTDTDRPRLAEVTAEWQNELRPELEELTRPICNQWQIPPAAMMLPRVDFSGRQWSVSFENINVSTDNLENYTTIANVVGAGVAGVVATSTLGSGAAAIVSTGPLAVVIAGVVVTMSKMSKKATMAANLPNWTRRLFSEERVVSKLRKDAYEQEAKLAGEIAREILDYGGSQLISEISRGIGSQLDILAEEAERQVGRPWEAIAHAEAAERRPREDR